MAVGFRNQERSLEVEIRPYELFMLVMCAFSLVALAVETFFHLSENDIAILDAIDNVVCAIFLADFFYSLVQASDKLQYLKWGWFDLLSSIPILDTFRAGRIIRVVRILRVLRGVCIARMLAQYLQRHRADGTFLAVIIFSLMLLLVSSVAILQVEQVEGANIQTPSDALWWAIVTMTTVGYGDKFPITTVGRIIASVLMVSGVGLFGTLSGSIASWMMNPVEERQEIDLDAIFGEMTAIHRRLDNLITRETISLEPKLAQLIELWPHLPDAVRKDVERLLSQVD